MAAATTVAGVATLRHVRHRRELPFAVIPLLFAVQQAIEGLLWLEFDGANDPTRIAGLSFAFLLFAKALWPILIAPAVLLIEPSRQRRVVLAGLALLGAAVAIDLLIDLIDDPAVATIRGHSIAYATGASPAAAGFPWDAIPYLLCTGVPLFVSSHKAVRMFGAVVVAGFAVAASVYFAAFVSVWCFFAAADSALLYVYFRHATCGLYAQHR